MQEMAVDLQHSALTLLPESASAYKYGNYDNTYSNFKDGEKIAGEMMPYKPQQRSQILQGNKQLYPRQV